ncbi:uncharacterized protein LOC126273406 [Schistocerca gregaria]|uniref:uncharacterized protein LOC126273406 n=1 Tax=Schistocerca gregaria TaxID=7010 RepID=UPI00211F1ACA|nr:uncharacterized protein LOC126273406 [Schistocerca gregaria]
MILLSLLKIRIQKNSQICDQYPQWCKTTDNRKVLVEHLETHSKRIEYLKKIKKYLEEGRPIINIDETYIHSLHTMRKEWTDEVREGQYLIIVHAGSKSGFVPNALLIYKSGTKTGDYHADMNAENFSRYFFFIFYYLIVVAVNKLILNVPQNSIVVLDNASYHNVLHEKPPIMHSRKADMAYWQNSQDIEFDQGSTKIELLALIESNKPTKIYTVVKLLAHYGHSVLLLPPYHPEINPIEMVWAKVKNWVATKNVTFKLEDVWKLAEENFSYITVHEWEAVC